MPDRTPFASRLAALRTAAGLTIAELARRAGVDPTHLGRYERGKKKPTLATADQIARALGVSLRKFDGCSLADLAREAVRRLG